MIEVEAETPDDDAEELEEGEEDLEDSDDPAILKADKDRLQSALDKERAKSARLKARLGGHPKPKDESPAADEAAALVRSEANKEIIAIKAEALLAGRGVKHPERLVRLANLSAVERLEDGSIEGLEDALDELEEDYPEFFGTPETEPVVTPGRPRAAGSSDGARRGTPPKKSVDAFTAFAEARFGRNR
jgi:rhamnose utilization protein RhaD (predicted bifunctional aldolase and dehydrogenase)